MSLPAMVLVGAVPLLWGCLVVLLVGLLLLVGHLIWQFREAARPRAAASSSEDGSSAQEGPAPTLLAELPDTFSGALSILRSRAPDSDFRYTIPWLLMLGPPGSGKSSLVSDSNLSTLLEEQVSLEHGAGLTWNFFDHGLLIEAGGWALTGTSASAAAWHRLLRLFVNNRGARPLDGLVLTIPLNDLTGPNALSSSALIERGALIHQRLRQLTQTLSFQLPMYVLLTKCDAIPGFGEFTAELAPEELAQIFGWSTPDEETAAFHPEWVDQALDSMRIALELRQGRLFAQHEPQAGRGEMFLFPGELFSLTPGLRLLLGRAMRGSEHAPPPLLRGIFCCGATNDQHVSLSGAAPLIPVSVPLSPSQRVRHPAAENFSFAAQQIASWLQADLRVAFTHDLFLKKIFAERGLARPLAHHFVVRDRLRNVLQIACAATALTLAIGTGLAWHRLAGDRGNLLRLFGSIQQNLESSSPADHSHLGADRFIRDMAGFETSGFRSVFIPVSWSDDVNGSIRRAMVPAFSVLVLGRFHDELEQRMREVASPYALPLANVPHVSPDTPLAPDQSLAGLPEYLQMNAYLQQVRQLHDFTLLYDQLRQERSGGNVGSIIALDAYLQNRQPDLSGQAVNNPYFDGAVSEAVWESLPYEEVRPALSYKAEKLSRELFTAWIGHNPVLTATVDLKDRIDSLARPGHHTFQQLTDTREAFSTATRTWARKDLLWTAADPFYLPPELASVTTQPLAETELFVPGLGERMQDVAADDFATFATETDSTSTALTGVLTHVDDSRIQLSDQAEEMQLALNNLLDLSFMSGFSGAGAATPAALTHFTWNKAALESAAMLPASYNNYLREDLGQAPVALQSALRSIAGSQLARTVSNAIVAAMQPALPLPPSPGVEPLTQRAQDFAAVQGTITSLEGSLAQAGLADAVTELRRATSTQAGELLLGFNRALDAQQPYDVSTYAISRWTLAGSPAEQIFDAPTSEALAAYLTDQRNFISSLATAAAPLVQYLRTEHGASSAEVSRVLARWEGIVNGVEQFQAKRPGNSIQVLEDLISTGADKFAASRTCDAAHLPAPLAARTDYFTLEASQFRRELLLRCRVLYTQSFDRAYADLAARFNRDLAGHFPFSTLDAARTVEATPESIDGVYREFSAASDLLLARMDDTPAKAVFLGQLQASRPWFAPILGTASAGQLPTLDIVPTFRVERASEIAGDQIIDWTLQVGQDTIHASDPERRMRWTYGDTIRFSLRWAKDAAFVPAPLPGPTGPGSAGSEHVVTNDTVSWMFTDPWSLLRLLRSFAAPPLKDTFPNPPPPFTLMFSVPELPASAGRAQLQPAPTDRAVVFIRIEVFAPGGKESITGNTFPLFAPP